MIIHQDTPFQKAIDAVESLPFDDREELLEILRMRIAEHRRDEIAANAKETLQAVREKRAKFGTVEDLKKDLLGD
jgi:predicted AAA+ superfamily ATPase